MPLCQDSAQGPKLSTHLAQAAKPKAIITWVFPTTNMFIQENWEVGGQEGGNRTEKQEKGKKTKAQPKARRGMRASGHVLGQGLSCTSLRLFVSSSGWGENDRSLPAVTASDILSTTHSGYQRPDANSELDMGLDAFKTSSQSLFSSELCALILQMETLRLREGKPPAKVMR